MPESLREPRASRPRESRPRPLARPKSRRRRPSPEAGVDAILAGMSQPPRSPEVGLLAADAGVWQATVHVRPGPGSPLQASDGTMSSRMCGPWLVSDFKNETSGFEGHGVYGWDSVERRYVGTWVDPMRRTIVVMLGRWDEATKSMTYVGEMSRPDGSRMRWREVTERPEDDLRVFRSFVPSADGTEFEVMTVQYRRTARGD
jgi:hypothetical protein